MADTGELGFEAELYELASNYAHIMNVAIDVPASVSRASGAGRDGLFGRALS